MKIVYLVSCALVGALAGVAVTGENPVLGLAAAVALAAAGTSGYRLFKIS